MGSWFRTQMKQRLKAIFKGPVVFYPLLFAIFPILFLYTYNIAEASRYVTLNAFMRLFLANINDAC